MKVGPVVTRGHRTETGLGEGQPPLLRHAVYVELDDSRGQLVHDGVVAPERGDVETVEGVIRVEHRNLGRQPADRRHAGRGVDGDSVSGAGAIDHDRVGRAVTLVGVGLPARSTATSVIRCR